MHPNRKLSTKKHWAVRGVYVLLALALCLGLAQVFVPRAVAANPAIVETYFIPLPDDWLMQHMEDLDATGGTGDPYPPVRDVIGITISSDGTWIYWDQWEDGYTADLANPTSGEIYSASNLDGTQIWGDGILANGCPPRFGDDPNPCTAASDDQLSAGDIIVLDNLVPITSSGGTHGPWLNGRSASTVRFDGKDKFGASFPVAATRAGWSEGTNGSVVESGSLLSDATAIEATSNWGTSFITPVGTNTTGFSSASMTYSHVTVQASQNTTAVCVDVPPSNAPNCNGTGDSSTTINAGQQYDPTSMPNTNDPQGVPEGTQIRTDKPVQVILVTGTVNSTWATRWYNLEPRPDWTSDYYAPVGTADASATCTAVWIYNPNGSQITVYYDFPGGASPNGNFTVNAGASTKAVNIPIDNGAHYYTTGSPAPVFYPVSVTECSGAQLYDWGYGLLPLDRLTDQVLVGWAPGCTTFSGPDECFDLTTPTAGTQGRSRTPVWVMPLASTTIYVDLNGSGITCPAGTGSEYSISATALTSYRLVDDPAEIVRDEFSTQDYGNNDSPTSENWDANWTETNDDGNDNNGAILINTTGDHLRFQNVSGSEAGRTIARRNGMGTNTKAILTFFLGSSNNLDDTDDLAVEVSNSASGPWALLEQFNNDPATIPVAKTYDISSYISANTTIRFRIVDDLETGDYWYVDNVTIAYGTGQVDFDMSGTRLATCDGTQIAAAWGQNPSLSYSGDDEALDMGTTIFPLGSRLTIDKTADKTQVAVGGPVVYSYAVKNYGSALSGISVTDNKCSPATYQSGDDGDNSLEFNETWIFTCSSNVFVDTTNVAYAQSTTPARISAPDQWTVTVIPPAVIGNYVWLDEDGDGDQDAGEAGIPNVLVTLTGTDSLGNAVNLTTYTDANGGYLFDGLLPSNGSGYTITVTPHIGLNNTYDEDTGTTSPNNTTTVVVASGDEHLSADFGYNWAPPADTNNNTNTGSIGDRVWIDADGDGFLDPGEAGIGGVTVSLLVDSNGDGIYGGAGDNPAVTTQTDAAGNYIFDGLSKGAYVVQVAPPGGYTQTGDPDDTPDHKTTEPVILGPGDVYVNADFGYQPTGDSSDIGDTIWFDADGDGVYEPNGSDGNAGTTADNERGIAGVTVALIKDDGDGVYEPGIDKIIATDVTDENGLYLFPGLPSGTYFTIVTDSENVLGELAPTGDADGGDDEISKVTVNGVADNLLQDFGYAPPGQDPGEGLIGDTIWLDTNNSVTYNPGEGLEGVKVTLTEPGADGILNTADDTTRVKYTDENGNYSFGNLEPSQSYKVTVDTTTLPNGGTGLTNTVDPDGGGNSTSTVNLSTSPGGINLNQDFAYQYQTNPNTISGTLWNDLDSDGLLEGTEAGRFDGVTVVLKDANGDIVATTTTGSGGSFTFSGLPNGTYTVDVTDDGNLLNGYWKSTGTNPTADNYSKVDPYSVTVSGGATNNTADFGYFIEPAEVGNFVWEDLDGDGIQDAGEPGIAGVPVTLTITWPNSGGTTTVKTTTDINGQYSFDNLLLDEDYLASGGTGQPGLSISISAPAGYGSSPQNQTTEDLDSDNPSGEPATATKGSTNTIYDFGLVRLGSIGNTVWLDEDGDADQDAGEAGIPNAMVRLCADAACTSVLATTYTDTNGGYLFPDRMIGTYYVKVTPPASLIQTYDENGALDNTSQVVLTAFGQEYVTADFGYNWSTTTETNTPTSDSTGAIGDRVWVDVDGDGKQDPEEPGISGVTVSLLVDSNGDGTYGGAGDTAAVTTTTDAAGNYLFDGLTVGAYVVQVTPPVNYSQTGDPDHFASTGTNDNKTTTPVVLAPGDVFVNADFGYTPNGASVGSIGDTVWFDANTNGAKDGAEYGIAGVTVVLIKDLGTIGVYEPGTDLIIATDITDASGQYLFSGLPANGTEDYLVWVNDTNNVIGDLAPTYDSNGTGTPNISAVANLTTAGNSLQDFGYAPSGQTTGEGLIGDFVWLDKDGDGTQDTGEPGLEGVTVRLYNSTGTTLLATTVTDENGRYSFGNLAASGAGVTYQVQVLTATLPAGVTQTGDPDATKDSKSTVTLTPAAPVSLSQDFGYQGTNTISGTIWTDTNADGALIEAGRFANVTVVLRDSGGDVVATTTTDGSGNYSFSNLPNGTYSVDVTDEANVLNGYWKSTGSSPGSDNNSQVDAYSVTVTGGQTNTTADFGYFVEPAAIGNFVWQDNNEDGIQDAGEPGLPNVKVILTITWPDTTTTEVATVTDSNGYYEFGYLLLDEDFSSPSSAFSLRVEPTTLPAGYGPTDIGVGDDDYDSEDPAGAPATATRGATNINDSIDFGFDPFPTGVTVVDFVANYISVNSVQIEWTAVDETDVAAYNIYRSGTPIMAQSVKINAEPIFVDLSGNPPHLYIYTDTGVATQTWYYWLAKIVAPGQNEVMMEDVPYATAVNRGVKLYLPITTK